MSYLMPVLRQLKVLHNHSNCLCKLWIVSPSPKINETKFRIFCRSRDSPNSQSRLQSLSIICMERME